jgi:hypothetical protein
MRRVVFCILLSWCLSIKAQIGGDAIFRFLDLSNSPRLLALGDPVTLLDSDISGTLSNPALIRGEHGGQLMVNYEPYFEGIHRGSAAYAHTLNRQKALVLDVNYIDYGNFEGADELGNTTGNFTGSEVALGLAASHYFLKPDIYVGARVRYILSNMEAYSSSGISTDLGVYYSPVSKTWRISLVFNNIGKQLTAYQDIYEPLPLNLILGYSNSLKYLPLRWHISLHHLNNWPMYFNNSEEKVSDLNGNFTVNSASFFKKLMRHATFGIEVFPEGLFSVRLGYHVQRAAELRILELRNFSGLSFGVGMQLRRLRFQISHSRHNLAGNRLFFGLTLEARP